MVDGQPLVGRSKVQLQYLWADIAGHAEHVSMEFVPCAPCAWLHPMCDLFPMGADRQAIARESSLDAGRCFLGAHHCACITEPLPSACRKPEDALKQWNDVAKLIGRAWRARQSWKQMLSHTVHQEQQDRCVAEQMRSFGWEAGTDPD